MTLIVFCDKIKVERIKNHGENITAHIIKWNGKHYLQEDGGNITTPINDEYVNDFLPEMPIGLNSTDTQHTCPYPECNTAYRRSEQQDPNRCPFCYRLIK